VLKPLYANVITPYERDPRNGAHGPEESLVKEMRAKASAAGLMTPHIVSDGSHLTQVETALVLKKSGLSPLGPVALNTGAPDEGNMFLLGKGATAEQKERFLDKLLSGEHRSAFFMTEPPLEGGAGSDPSMLKTTAVQDGNHWVINGRKTYITGAEGANVGIVMAMAEEGASQTALDWRRCVLPLPVCPIACVGTGWERAPKKLRLIMPAAEKPLVKKSSITKALDLSSRKIKWTLSKLSW